MNAPPHAVVAIASVAVGAVGGDASLPHDHVAVVCEHADRCGGCPLLGFGYEEQLAQKRSRVVRAVARHAGLDVVAPPVIAATPIVGYRTRAKLIAAPGGAIGLFAKGGGHRVVDVPGCRVLTPTLSAVAAAIRDMVRAAEAAGEALAPFDASSATGTSGTRGGMLRAVDLREVRDDDRPRALVTFVVERSVASDTSALSRAIDRAARELMKRMPDVVGVAVNFHSKIEGRDAPQILGSETRLVAGASRALDRTGSSVHFATFGSFVQAHRGQAERVHALLAEAIGLSPGRRKEHGPRVLDLYGGSGAIALALASAGARVTLVESFPGAAQQAAAAAEAQRLDVDAVVSDAAAAVRVLADRGERFDAAVVNPPRRGASPETREALARLSPAVITYVSCEPETLARDLAHLGRLGYQTTALQPLDMIPLTGEVETVAILRRAEIPTPSVVYEDDELVVVDKGSHEPMAPDRSFAGSLQARVRRMAGADQAIPVHWLDPGTSGVAIFVRDAGQVAKWRAALAAPSTRTIYVAAVRGVTPSKGKIARALREGSALVPARTRYRRASIAGGHSVLRVVPDALDGHRTHPLLRHLASIGHPVLGDARYGHPPTNRHFEEKRGLDRTFLHASRFEIIHPDTSKRLVFEAPLAGDLEAVLATLAE